VGHLYLVLSADVVGLVFVEVRVLANAEKVVILTVMMAVFNSRHFSFLLVGLGMRRVSTSVLSMSGMLMGP
jgi:hypothetical protein